MNMSEPQAISDIDQLDGNSTNTKIFKAIADVFQKAQSTYAGHRRHVAVIKTIRAKAVSQGYEEVFNYWFNKMVTLILPLKRKDVVGDRIIRLVAAFIASCEHDLELEDSTGGDRANREIIQTRFIDQFIRHILRGVESRDKHVRYRVTQLLAVIMDNIGEIDEELYKLMMWSLQKRVYDKEASVRIQAIFCLTKFQDEDNLTGKLDPATEKLQIAVQNDPNAEVRRAAMLNLVNTNSTRAFILERARDVNPVNRRLVYSRVLKSMGQKVFTHLEQRLLDQLLHWGLQDREEAVRTACAKLIAFDLLNLMDGDIIRLLSKLNVTKSTCCYSVMDAVFKGRPDIITKIKFPDEVWGELTAETAFLIKSFYFYCSQNYLNEIIDSSFPEAAKFAEVIQVYVERMFIDQTHSGAADQNVLSFIIQQLLSVAHKYDFSDEIGRRAMLTVIRNSLANYQLKESLVKVSLRVLEVLSINERDFIAMTVEIITDIRDDDIEKQEREDAKKASDKQELIQEENDDAIESFHSAVENLVNGNTEIMKNPDTVVPERDASPATLLICLTMSQYMLELVNNPLQQNIMISSLIDTLITPAVRNTQPEIRELGVRNLGLCCLLDVQLATESMYILGMCVSKGDASLKHIALQVIVDIFSVHGTKVVDGEGKVDSISLHKIFYKILKNNENPSCQAIAAEGLCKLFLGDVFVDDDLFETLVLSYFSPANSKNEALVQAFAFCLPVYCYSHTQHQSRMSRIAADVLLRLTMLWNDLHTNEDDEMPIASMMKPNEIFQQLIDWTDPSRLVQRKDQEIQNIDVQLDFLLNVLKLYNRFERKDIKKMLLINIGRFTLTQENDLEKMKDIYDLLEDIVENDDIDNASRNSVKKFLIYLKDNITHAEEIAANKTKEEPEDSDEQFSSILGMTGEQSSPVEQSIAHYSYESACDEQDKDQPHHSLQEHSVERSSGSSILDDVPLPEEIQQRVRTRKRTRTEVEEQSEVQSTDRFSENDRDSRTVSFVLPQGDDIRSNFAEDDSYYES
ncbi:LAFE_0D07184g1_1 [Lachancea fermentati]|uniref:LAFE_0D07184g1_1 n=1 Tax=Lachancea fermentati TaxID=4955 RepID=A0A1G4MBJ2_LACFM|nr:LAFE_0D07184g1_1 [Lachancea fermentati]